MHPKGPLILSAQPDFKFHRQTEQASAADIRTSHFDPSQHHQVSLVCKHENMYLVFKFEKRHIVCKSNVTMCDYEKKCFLPKKTKRNVVFFFQNPANRLLESPLSKSQSNYLSAEIHNLIEASSNKKVN